MKRIYCLLIVLLSLASGCGQTEARTSSFVPSPNVTALVGLPDGSLRYANSSGEFFDVDDEGHGSNQPIAVAQGISPDGVLGMVEDKDNRTFASWVDAATRTLTIAEIVPGPVRVIYRGKDPVRQVHPGGRLALSGENRIVATVSTESTSQVISVDPDRNDDQKANVLSKNWNDLGGIAYAAGHVLWAIDNGSATTGDRVARTGMDGPTGTIDIVNKTTETPMALAPYGDIELVACFAKTGVLQRFSINDGIQTLKGRQLATDCTGDTTQLHDGRLAYVAKGEVRVTAL